MAHVNETVSFRALGTTYKVLSSSVNGSVAIVEHTLEARTLGAPMHKHSYEDETSYVLEGELTVIQNEEICVAKPGEFIVKPRGVFHTFWNANDKKIRFIEIISPGGFELYFAEMAPFFSQGNPPQLEKMKQVAMKYGLVTDPNAAKEIIRKFRLNPIS